MSGDVCLPDQGLLGRAWELKTKLLPGVSDDCCCAYDRMCVVQSH